MSLVRKECQPNPAPGSDEAVAAGCRCPVDDNARGKGWMTVKGVYWINKDCPLHGGEAAP